MPLKLKELQDSAHGFNLIFIHNAEERRTWKAPLNGAKNTG
jgi:hypothetical protein